MRPLERYAASGDHDGSGSSRSASGQFLLNILLTSPNWTPGIVHAPAGAIAERTR
jgi:hypothetical protein